MNTNLVTIFLGIIAAVEIIRFFTLYNPIRLNRRKTYFKSRLPQLEYAMLDMEYALFKFREGREQIRRERDEKKMRYETLLEEIKKQARAGGCHEQDIEECLKAGAETSNKFAEKLKVYATYTQNQIDEFRRLIDTKDLLERDIKRVEEKMRAVDLEINGSKPSVEHPDGVTGITQKTDELAESKAQLKVWIKKFC